MILQTSQSPSHHTGSAGPAPGVRRVALAAREPPIQFKFKTSMGTALCSSYCDQLSALTFKFKLRPL